MKRNLSDENVWCRLSFKSLKYHKCRIWFIAHLRHKSNLDKQKMRSKSYLNCKTFTSLNVLRLHAMLPNILSPMGSWATTKTVGNIFCMPMGNKYHLIWSNTIHISSNTALTRWPNSQRTKIMAYEAHNKPNVSNISAELFTFFWSWKETDRKKRFVCKFQSYFWRLFAC